MYFIGTIQHFCPVFTGQRPSKLGKLGAQFKLGILESMVCLDSPGVVGMTVKNGRQSAGLTGVKSPASKPPPADKVAVRL